ncbi:MAG TPA: signal peptidase II [Dehalococcoidia bacterium]|nr:signal peptidase II [Dehalococcoidia bacterium]
MTEAVSTDSGRVTRGRAHSALRHLWFFGVALLVVALDQASKQAVRSFMDLHDYYPSNDWPVRLHYVTNTGAAFGVLQDQAAFLALTSIIGLGAIVLYYWTQSTGHALVSVAMGMMLGGAAGNLIDRVRLGKVTDFIDFPHYPSFNLADSSIVIAVVILIVTYGLLEPKTERDARGPGPEPSADR